MPPFIPPPSKNKESIFQHCAIATKAIISIVVLVVVVVVVAAATVAVAAIVIDMITYNSFIICKRKESRIFM
jgi:hypothetical protein